MRARTVVAAGLGVLTVATVSACSPVPDGMVGLQREQDGSLSAVVHMCHDHVDRVQLLDLDTGDEEVWTFGTEVAGTGAFPLVEVVERQLRDGHVYALGASAYHVASAEGPTITADSVAALAPGQVLVDPFMVDPDVEDPPEAQVVASSEFEGLAGDYCDSV
jgi:hypothetical protein